MNAGGAKNAQLRYDPLGRLYEIAGPTGTTRFLYDGDALIGEYDGSGNLLRRYIHGADMKSDDPIAWYEGGGFDGASERMLRPDWQGSIALVTDNSGSNIFAVNTYDEYGIPGSSNTGRFQYTGQAWTAELGMYYYKARFYSPTLGRFLQTDPIGYKDQVNLYAYVGNDPVDGTDPTGMDAKSDSQCNQESPNSCSTTATTAYDSRGRLVEGAAWKAAASPFTTIEQVDAFWEILARAGEPVAKLAPNFKWEGKPTDFLASFSRNALMHVVMTQNQVGGRGKYDFSAAKKEWNSIRVALANAHYNMIARSNLPIGQVYVANVRNYHHEVFAQFGIGKEIYGGTFIFGGDWEDAYSKLWCPSSHCH